MDQWAIIRQRAAEVLATYEERTGRAAFGPDAGSYACLSDIAHEVYRLTVVDDDELPEGVSGQLDPEGKTIGYRAADPTTRQHFTIAHEIGHAALKHPPRRLLERTDDINDMPDIDALTVRDGVYRAYSDHDRWELQANVFAAELLAPVEHVRAAVLSDPGWSVGALARYFGLSRAAMLNQLATALLPGPAAERRIEAEVLPQMDASQSRAAKVAAPALVIAGPGAGKTRVLTERFASLVEAGTDPARILALTFGNKAAEEMRERIAARMPVHAHLINVTTFHALGLELLQSYGQYLGLKPDPQLLTDVDAFVLLRRRLGELSMGPFEDLHRPTHHLRHILTAISRAKDELVGPEECARRAAAWQAEVAARAAPESEEASTRLAADQEHAARCVAVGAVYATYQTWLRAGNYLDYGDLIAEATRLFDISEVAADICGRYDHILVDEFQDINFASGRLVRALDGGRGIVWAVGDPRQSIYRFRGASPVNLRDFTTDYPGADITHLEWNYRSVEDIVAAGQAVRMPGSVGDGLSHGPPLRAERGRLSEQPAIDVLVAPTGADEIAAIVERVKAATDGAAFGDVAVLCRTTAQAQAVSDAIEAAGIPTDWGGAIEERATFKDIFGVLLFGADDPQGLVRLARMPEHRLEEDDLRRLLDAARTRGRSVRDALAAACAGEVTGLTAEGALQTTRLRRLLTTLADATTPWHALAEYLFEHATWPRSLFEDTSSAARRRLATLGQIGALAREFAQRATFAGGDDIRAFLDFLRSGLEAGDLGTPDELPPSDDTVHVLTVHRSKGLEWPVVLVPNLAQGRFPLDDDHPPLPLPPGLIRGADPDEHAVEETCLFYVAITRARDQLILTRAAKYGRGQATAAPLLVDLAETLEPMGYLRTTEVPTLPTSPPGTPVFRAEPPIFVGEVPFRALETYEDCGQRYKYENVYRLGDDERGYLAFHSAVYAVLAWAAERAAGGAVPSPDLVAREFAARWEAVGPKDHWFAGVYHRRGERIIAAFVARLHPGSRITVRARIPLRIGDRTLILTADEIEEAGALRIYRRHHFGHPAKSHRDDHRLALFVAAHNQRHEGEPFDVRLWYPLHGSDESAVPTARVIANRTAKMEALASAIGAGRYIPKPSPYRCSVCPFAFICPA